MRKDTKRAWRRYHADRMRKKIRNLLLNIWTDSYYIDMEQEEPEEFRGITSSRSKHRKVCSCFMCGNPRRYFKELSIQEKRWC